MSKIKKVLEVIEVLKDCSQTLEEAAKDIEEMFKTPDLVKNEEVVKEKEITLEELRGLMAQKSRDGFTKEMKAIIKHLGYSRLTDVPKEHYQEMLKQVKEVGVNG